MVKRGAGNGRVHVVLPIPFRTNSSFFALLHRRLRCGAANSWSGTTAIRARPKMEAHSALPCRQRHLMRLHG
jgi:hypothetical protein